LISDILEKSIDFAHLGGASIKLFITATNVHTGRGRVFRKQGHHPLRPPRLGLLADDVPGDRDRRRALLGRRLRFGAVVAAMPAFAMVRDAVLAIGGGPLMSLAVATNILAALTGSASGGLTIALDALGRPTSSAPRRSAWTRRSSTVSR
jgi:hypothetical protein